MSHAKLCLFCVVYIIYFRKTWLFSFLEIKFENGAHLKKGLFLTYFSHFLVTRESYKNSFSTYLTHIHTCILLTLLTFLPYQFWKKKWIYQARDIRYGFSLVWFLVLILICAILEQPINNKKVSKTQVEMSTTDMYLHQCQIYSHL